MDKAISDLLELESNNSLGLNRDDKDKLRRVIDTLVNSRDRTDKTDKTGTDELLQEIKKITTPKITRESIMDIKDTTARLKAIRENMELFD